MDKKEYIKRLEAVIDGLEKKLLTLDPNSRPYNNVKNEQWKNINELKKIRKDIEE